MYSASTVAEVAAHGWAVGDERDDPHRAATVGAPQREHFVDVSEQHGPCVTGGATMRRFGAGSSVAAGGAVVAPGARAVTAGRNGALGARTPK